MVRGRQRARRACGGRKLRAGDPQNVITSVRVCVRVRVRVRVRVGVGVRVRVGVRVCVRLFGRSLVPSHSFGRSLNQW